ncbi:MAG: hypothetical protein Q4G63_10050 [Bacteroidia bacterium]|nr:hypothetical protein [Bacteroidia bacterium]
MNLNLEKVEITKSEYNAFLKILKTIGMFKHTGGFSSLPKTMLGLNSAFLLINAELPEDSRFEADFISSVAHHLDMLITFLYDLSDGLDNVDLMTSEYNQN